LWDTYVQYSQLAFIVEDRIVESHQGNIIVGSLPPSFLHVFVHRMNDELGNAKGVVVVAKGFARGLELGEGEDFVGAHKQLEKKELKRSVSRD
jgi:hypothetical protein